MRRSSTAPTWTNPALLISTSITPDFRWMEETALRTEVSSHTSISRLSRGSVFSLAIASRRARFSAERPAAKRSEEHTSELQSPDHLVCRLLLEKKKKTHKTS